MENVITGASTMLSHPVEEEKSAEQKHIERVEDVNDKMLVALSHHPGWLYLRGIIEKDIATISNLENVDFAQLEDDQLGRAVRTERLVAERLKVYLAKVDNAAAESSLSEVDEGVDDEQ